jgi:hypothetical protein
MNGRSLSRSILPPPGRPAALADGGFDVDLIEVLAEMYGKGLLMDGRKAQSFQSTARAGWPRFSLAVPLPPPMQLHEMSNSCNALQLSRRVRLASERRPRYEYVEV